jgi:hypothetical protein
MLAFRRSKGIALCLQLKKAVVESTYLTVCVNKCCKSVIKMKAMLTPSMAFGRMDGNGQSKLWASFRIQ